MIEQHLNKVIQGDCLEFMKTLPDKCIDLVLTDPPYGINADTGVGGFGSSKTDRHYKGGWDSKTPSKEYFDQILRVSKKVIIFGGQFFTDKLPVMSHWIVWDKKGGVEFDNPFGDCELIWTNMDRKSVKKYTVIQQGFITEDLSPRLHPTQKPDVLISKLVNDYSKEGEIVFDPFAGSCTTAVACKELGRNYICVEKEEDYVKVCNLRINSMSDSLFK